MLTAAANRVLRSEVAARARLLAADADAAFALDAAGMLRWRGGPVGRLVAGERMLTPRAEPLAGDFIEGEAREKVRQRLAAVCPRRDRAPAGAAVRRLGLAARRGRARSRLSARRRARRLAGGARWRAEVAALDPADRAALGRLGVRFGTETVYFEPLLRPEALRFRALLWAVRHGREVPPLPPARRLAKAIDDRSGVAAVVLCRARLFCRRRSGVAAGPARAARRRGAAPRPPGPVRGRRSGSRRSPASSPAGCGGC